MSMIIFLIAGVRGSTSDTPSNLYGILLDGKLLTKNGAAVTITL